MLADKGGLSAPGGSWGGAGEAVSTHGMCFYITSHLLGGGGREWGAEGCRPRGALIEHTPPCPLTAGGSAAPGPAAGANERRGSLVTHALTAQDGRAGPSLAPGVINALPGGVTGGPHRQEGGFTDWLAGSFSLAFSEAVRLPLPSRSLPGPRGFSRCRCAPTPSGGPHACGVT